MGVEHLVESVKAIEKQRPKALRLPLTEEMPKFVGETDTVQLILQMRHPTSGMSRFPNSFDLDAEITRYQGVPFDRLLQQNQTIVSTLSVRYQPKTTTNQTPPRPTPVRSMVEYFGSLVSGQR